MKDLRDRYLRLKKTQKKPNSGASASDVPAPVAWRFYPLLQWLDPFLYPLPAQPRTSSNFVMHGAGEEEKLQEDGEEEEEEEEGGGIIPLAIPS